MRLDADHENRGALVFAAAFQCRGHLFGAGGSERQRPKLSALAARSTSR